MSACRCRSRLPLSRWGSQNSSGQWSVVRSKIKRISAVGCFPHSLFLTPQTSEWTTEQVHSQLGVGWARCALPILRDFCRGNGSFPRTGACGVAGGRPIALRFARLRLLEQQLPNDEGIGGQGS
jgi:hypothetical protein